MVIRRVVVVVVALAADWKSYLRDGLIWIIYFFLADQRLARANGKVGGMAARARPSIDAAAAEEIRRWVGWLGMGTRDGWRMGMNKLDLDINSAFQIYWNDGDFHCVWTGSVGRCFCCCCCCCWSVLLIKIYRQGGRERKSAVLQKIIHCELSNWTEWQQMGGWEDGTIYWHITPVVQR